MADATPKKPAAKRAARKPAARKPAAVKPDAPMRASKESPGAQPAQGELSDAQRDQIIAEHEAAREATRTQIRYVRNLSGAPFRIKLGRHTAGQRGIQLKPRGERGDMAPLEPNDIEDMILRDNLSLGLIEIITSSEATGAMSKQTVNQQSVHPALAALKNEKGDGGLTLNVEKSFEDQGIVVAQLEDGQIAFERGKAGPNIVRRQPGESPGTPANIPGAEPGHAPANESASFLSDLRSKTTVNPTQQG